MLHETASFSPRRGMSAVQVLLRTKPLMERGVVRKVLVCFFQEPELGERAPTERVAFDVRVHDDEEASLEPLRLQVCTRGRAVSVNLLSISEFSAGTPTAANPPADAALLRQPPS